MADTVRPYAGIKVDPRIGFGLVWPLRRNGRGDFVAGSGIDLVKAGLSMLLGTVCAGEHTDGEYAWNPEFGSLLDLLRHRNNNVTRREMARHYIIDAITRWEPRVRLKDVAVVAIDVPPGISNGEVLRVLFDIVSSRDGRTVLHSDVSLDVPLQPPV